MKIVRYDEKGAILGYLDPEVFCKWIPAEYDDDGNLIKQGYWDTSSISGLFDFITDDKWKEAVLTCANYYDAKNKILIKKDFIDVESYKETIKSKIEKIYNIATQLNIVYNDHTFQADKNSQDILTKILILLPDDQNITWYDIKNQPVDFSKEDLKVIALSILDRGEKLFKIKMNLKQELDKKETIDELDIFDYKTQFVDVVEDFNKDKFISLIARI